MTRSDAVCPNRVVSRRDLVLGGGALGAATLLSGADRPRALAQEVSASPDIPDAWDEEADVVIVGFGAAGCSAAMGALESGADVLVLEKMDEERAGGDTTCFSGVLWAVDDPDLLEQYSSHSISQETAQATGKATARALELFTTCPGVEMDGATIVGGAPAFYAALSQECVARGARVFYQTPATSLIFDAAAGEVKGVRARRDDQTITVKARRGVIIASGSYAANYDLVRSWHFPGMVNSTLGGIANTGDGLVMACKIGARPAHISDLSLEWAGFALTKASEDLGCGVIYNYSGALTNEGTSAAKIFVNCAGERFTNEEAALGHCRNTDSLRSIDTRGDLNIDVPGYKNLPMFLVVDSKTVEGGSLVPNEGTGWRIKHQTYTWSDDNRAEIERGWLIEADTLEELAGLMTSHDYITGEEVAVPYETLQQTVNTYNEACAAGGDAFGRTVMEPLGTPPYYAAEMNMCTLYSIGGLDGDEHSRVLDWDNQPIGRLYRAGNIGLNSDWFPLGVCACGGQGLMAAEHVMTLAPWDEA